MRLRAAAAAALLSAAAACAQAADWVIVPGRRAGPIDAGTSEARLVELFGARNVTRASFEVEPGEQLPATVLFADDPSRRAIVLWRDSDARAAPESMLIRGQRTLWKTEKGITLGTSLATLHRLNGRPLALTGFGWDLAGTVLDCNGGHLAELGRQTRDGLVGRTLVVRVLPRPALQDTPAYQQFTGDREFSSDSDAMRSLDPRIWELIVDLAPR